MVQTFYGEASEEGGKYAHDEVVPSSSNNEEESSVLDITNEEDQSEDKAPPRKFWFTVNGFLFFLASFQILNLLTLTYTDSVLNYISKRFQIPNTMASFIPSSYQVGNMIAILPVSFFGAKWHRPRAICFGVIIMLFGLGCCVLPHFMMPSESDIHRMSRKSLCHRTVPKLEDMKILLNALDRNFTRPVWNHTETELITRKPFDLNKDPKVVNWFTSVIHSIANNYHSDDKLIKPSLTAPLELPCNNNGTVYNPSILLIIGHALVGMGASPFWPLGISYLDDHLVSQKVPLYLGIFVGTTLTGPVAGFLLGSLSSAIYVSIDSHNIKPTDPAWIGAWWLGYVIAALLLFILLVPFSFFPASLPLSKEKLKELKSRREENSESEDVDPSLDPAHSECSSTIGDCNPDCTMGESIPLICPDEADRTQICGIIAGLACSIRHLLTIPAVVCAFSSYIILANLLSGVTTFGSTFIQKEFNVLRFTSDMLIGGICVPLAIVGTFGGGFVMNKFNFAINQTLVFNVIMSSIGTVFISTLFAMGCDDIKIAGITLPYRDDRVINLTSSCNRGCDCLSGELNFACSSNNITYISPCYAGCTTQIPNPFGSEAARTYSDCSCVDTEFRNLKSGSCKTPHCGGLLAVSMIAVGIGIFILCLCQVPTYTVLLRSIESDLKPLAIGLLTFLARILGFVPAPIWFGLVIDESCIYWGPECKGKSACKLYHNEQLRFKYVGACVGCACGYVLSFALTALWVSFKPSKAREAENDMDDKSTDEDAK